MRAFGSAVQVIVNLVLAILLLVDGIFVWAAWPMSDSRFDWTPYLSGLITRNQCDDAAHLLGDLVLTYEDDAVSASRAFIEAKSCPVSAAGAPELMRLRSRLSMVEADLRSAKGAWQARWRPDWRGVWLARESYWAPVTTSWRELKSGKIGPGAFPGTVVKGWRCAPLAGPGGAYYASRTDLGRTYPQLLLADWEARVAKCGAAPVGVPS